MLKAVINERMPIRREALEAQEVALYFDGRLISADFGEHR
jgi:hypothetical protein